MSGASISDRAPRRPIARTIAIAIPAPTQPRSMLAVDREPNAARYTTFTLHALQFVAHTPPHMCTPATPSTIATSCSWKCARAVASEVRSVATLSELRRGETHPARHR